MFFAEVVIFVFSASPHFFFEGPFEVLYVDFELVSAAAEGVGDFDLFDVVDAEQVGDGVEYSFFEVVDDFNDFLFFRKAEGLDDHFYFARVSVGVHFDLSEHFVQAFFDELEVAMEHF